MRKVASIQTGGSTNLSGGMLEGYRQVKSTIEENVINRVLLLSDGLANQGITDMSELQNIVEQKFSNEGIAISTFGVGTDYNEDLMTNLAEYGRGNYYFIGAADEIPGIFKQELDGLLSVVAQNTTLKVKFPSRYFEFDKVYGYTGRVEGDEVVINYNDVFAQEEKTVLLRFKKKESITEDQEFKVTLSYDDALKGYQYISHATDIPLRITTDNELYAESKVAEVERNVILFESLEAYDLAAKKVDEGEYEEAKDIIRQNIVYMDTKFKEVAPDSAMLKNYEANTVYEKDIEDIEDKSEREVKFMQKSNKSINYSLRKKKSK